MKDFEQMTNKQLAAYCVSHNIEVQSRNVSKPTKSEFLDSIYNVQHEASNVDLEDEGLLENFDEDEGLDEFLNIDDEEDETQTLREQLSKPTRKETRKEQVQAMTKLQRVIITENDKTQTTLPNQVHFCLWGNRLIGYYNDRFVLGAKWHVREGALRNLQGMMSARSIQDEEGNTIKHEYVNKYIIQRFDMLTPEEIATIEKRQLIRDSSIESLI